MSIQRLTYRVEKPTAFADEDAVTYSHAVADFTLANGLLAVQLRSPADSLSDARARIDPVVRAWEFEAEIRSGFPVISFAFTPVAAVGETGHRSLKASEEIAGEVGLVIQSWYPPGPTIALTTEMTTIWERYRRARLGLGEPLEGAVYYALTVVEARFGSRPKAAAALNLSSRILAKLGQLSSTRGDSATARKAHTSGEPLSRSEKRWIDHALRHVLLQLGHLAANLPPPRVNADALPDLV